MDGANCLTQWVNHLSQPNLTYKNLFENTTKRPLRAVATRGTIPKCSVICWLKNVRDNLYLDWFVRTFQSIILICIRSNFFNLTVGIQHVVLFVGYFVFLFISVCSLGGREGERGYWAVYNQSPKFYNKVFSY